MGQRAPRLRRRHSVAPTREQQLSRLMARQLDELREVMATSPSAQARHELGGIALLLREAHELLNHGMSSNEGIAPFFDEQRVQRAEMLLDASAERLQLMHQPSLHTPLSAIETMKQVQ